MDVWCSCVGVGCRLNHMSSHGREGGHFCVATRVAYYYIYTQYDAL